MVEEGVFVYRSPEKKTLVLVVVFLEKRNFNLKICPELYRSSKHVFMTEDRPGSNKTNKEVNVKVGIGLFYRFIRYLGSEGALDVRE